MNRRPNKRHYYFSIKIPDNNQKLTIRNRYIPSISITSSKIIMVPWLQACSQGSLQPTSHNGSFQKTVRSAWRGLTLSLRRRASITITERYHSHMRSLSEATTGNLWMNRMNTCRVLREFSKVATLKSQTQLSGSLTHFKRKLNWTKAKITGLKIYKNTPNFYIWTQKRSCPNQATQ